MDAHVLGRRLREARLAAGLTQSQVAAGMTSVTHVSRIETGLRRPRPELLELFAGTLRVDLEALLSDDATAAVDLTVVPWAEHLRASNAARATALWLGSPRSQAAYRRMLDAVAAWEAETSALHP